MSVRGSVWGQCLLGAVSVRGKCLLGDSVRGQC